MKAERATFLLIAALGEMRAVLDDAAGLRLGARLDDLVEACRLLGGVTTHLRCGAGRGARRCSARPLPSPAWRCPYACRCAGATPPASRAARGQGRGSAAAKLLAKGCRSSAESKRAAAGGQA